MPTTSPLEQLQVLMALARFREQAKETPAEELNRLALKSAKAQAQEVQSVPGGMGDVEQFLRRQAMVRSDPLIKPEAYAERVGDIGMEIFGGEDPRKNYELKKQMKRAGLDIQMTPEEMELEARESKMALRPGQARMDVLVERRQEDIADIAQRVKAFPDLINEALVPTSMTDAVANYLGMSPMLEDYRRNKREDEEAIRKAQEALPFLDPNRPFNAADARKFNAAKARAKEIRDILGNLRDRSFFQPVSRATFERRVETKRKEVEGQVENEIAQYKAEGKKLPEGYGGWGTPDIVDERVQDWVNQNFSFEGTDKPWDIKAGAPPEGMVFEAIDPELVAGLRLESMMIQRKIAEYTKLMYGPQGGPTGLDLTDPTVREGLMDEWRRRNIPPVMPSHGVADTLFGGGL